MSGLAWRTSWATGRRRLGQVLPGGGHGQLDVVMLVDDALEPFEPGALERKLRQAGDVRDLAGILALAGLNNDLGDVGAVLLEGDAGVDQLPLDLRLERVEAGAAGGEDAADDNAFGDRLLDDRSEGVAVIG